MAPHAFVLHLLRAEQRRDNAHALKHSCGLKADIWPAVDGRSMSSSDLASTIGAQLFQPTYPFPLKSGEIGCFLSHRQIWAEIVRRGLDAALILEDDISLDAALFAPALALASTHIATLGYIKFKAEAPKVPGTLIDRQGRATLVRTPQPGLSAAAQLVSAEAAQHLLDSSQVFDRPVDTFVQSYWHTGLQPAVIYPSGVHHRDAELGGTTIQHSQDTRLQKLQRAVKRASYRRQVKKLSKQYHTP